MIILEVKIDRFSNLLVSEIELIIGITLIIPNEFALHLAYPNPFNPVTTIIFSVPVVESLRVTTLHIFDINGRLIETLVDGNMDAGDFSASQKLILVK